MTHNGMLSLAHRNRDVFRPMRMSQSLAAGSLTPPPRLPSKSACHLVIQPLTEMWKSHEIRGCVRLQNKHCGTFDLSKKSS